MGVWLQLRCAMYVTHSCLDMNVLVGLFWREAHGFGVGPLLSAAQREAPTWKPRPIDWSSGGVSRIVYLMLLLLLALPLALLGRTCCVLCASTVLGKPFSLSHAIGQPTVPTVLE